MYQWVRGNVNSNIVTLYPNNFTLNNIAASYFQDCRWCCLGIDKENYKIAIKPITKREIDLKLVPVENLHKVSMGKGYARISNKMIIEEIAKMLDETCNGIKFSAAFDEKEKMLVIDLQDRI